MAITITQVYKKYENTQEYGQIKVVIPSADVLNLGTQATLIAAPGAGKQIECEYFIVVCASGTAYVANTTLWIANDTATIPQWFSQSALLTAATVRTVNGIIFQGSGTVDTQIISNKALVVKTDGGNTTTGTFQVTLYVNYKIITL